MNNACPSCGAVYGVQPQHIGRRITCKKCNANMVVTVDGLQLEGSAPPPPAAGGDPMAAPDPFAGGTPSRRRGISNPFADAGLDVSTVIFGAGVFLTLLFLFMPLVDSAAVLSRNADIQRERASFNRLKDSDKTATKREAHQEELKRLNERLEDTQISQNKWVWWYRWGMMFAFLVLSAGCLAYMGPTQATYRRILGVVVLAGLLLSIVYYYVVILGQRAPGGPAEGGNEPGLGAQFK